MRCILVGHRPVKSYGSGDRTGRFAVICSQCGKTLEEGTTDAAPRLRGYEAVRQEASRGSR